MYQQWRSKAINDTYEPGSTFKIITAAAALEEGVVSLTDQFYCPGYKLVEDRRIRCAKTSGHGAETFETGIMNSCNPVFIELGERLGRGCRIVSGRKKGRIELEYYGTDDLNDLLDALHAIKKK